MRWVPGAPPEDIVEDMRRRRKAKRIDYLVRMSCIFVIVFGVALALLQLAASWRYQLGAG